MMYSLGAMRPQMDSTVYVAPGAQIIGNVTIGSESSIWFNTVIRGDNAPIIIGERTNIQDGSILHVDHDAALYVGNHVTVGHHVILHGATIRDGALIGMGAIVMNYTEIGENSLIAAGALIPEGKRIPPRSLVVGSPGRVVRELTDEDLEKMERGCLSYVKRSREFMQYGIVHPESQNR